MPGMLTGTIIGMAQALGETAPINDRNVAFIVDVPNSSRSWHCFASSNIYVG